MVADAPWGSQRPRSLTTPGMGVQQPWLLPPWGGGATIHCLILRSGANTKSHQAKTSNMKPRTFIKLYEGPLKLVCNMTHVKKLLDAEEGTSWVQLSQPLNAIVAESRIGQQLFGFAVQNVLASQVQNAIRDKLKTLEKQDLNAALIATTQAGLIDHTDNMTNIELLPLKREICLQYKGFDLNVNVSNIVDEIVANLAAFWKASAVKQGLLLPLWCEDMRHPKHIRRAFPARPLGSATRSGLPWSTMGDQGRP